LAGYVSLAGHLDDIGRELLWGAARGAHEIKAKNLIRNTYGVPHLCWGKFVIFQNFPQKGKRGRGAEVVPKKCDDATRLRGRGALFFGKGLGSVC
jgi:hypothetical protein